ncbi:MAG: 23S rRNA (uracil(1939)-C(5))-methyltransferase RlmD [Saprospiraceae bacterium]|nr:23S rRNA (uracil(1939)-C(5))-methyltransferase RlmD [Saprospiraceae bacterium]
MGRQRRPITLTEVTITGIADKGRAVGRDTEGRVVFVEKVVPGDVVDVRVTKKRKGYMMGFPIQFRSYSTDRVEPFCAHFGACGGCKWQNLSYEVQIDQKEQIVKNALERIAKVEIGEFFPILGAEETRYYRNKMEFAFSNKRWLTAEELNNDDVSNEQNVLGFHPQGAFDKIIDIEHCWLQGTPSNEIRNAIREIALEQKLEFFDVRAQKGFLRHMIVRTSSLGETLLLLSFYQEDEKKRKNFLDAVIKQFPEITTVIYTINSKANDFLLDLDMHTYSGKGYIEEALGHVRFRVGPKSFFQTNTRQASVLYDVVVKFAGLDGTQNVYDLYTGVGSIALYIAQHSKHVTGVEEIEAAIEDAKLNAQLNGIENTTFYAGDVKDILTNEFTEKHGKPDLVITDPPRAGMHPKVVEIFRELKAPKIVYVSCNPATQARDLQLLNDLYTVEMVQPVDMFPHTHHIENVALLKLREVPLVIAE